MSLQSHDFTVYISEVLQSKDRRLCSWNGSRIILVKPYSNVQLLEANLDRNYFTRHGMHLNSKGKELYSKQLATIVEKIFRKEQLVPISIPWDVPFLVPNDTETQDLNTDGKISEAAESSQHRRKCPVRRNPDFLWI